MSHIMFQTTPVPTTAAKAVSSASSSSTLAAPRYSTSYPVGVRVRRKNMLITCSVPSPLIDGGDHSVVLLERCYKAPSALPSGSTAEYGPLMKGGQYGAFGAVTLEKGKLDTTQQQSETTPELATGGGGGDIGKKINHGGGDGGDDDGDDDDYFDDFDDGDEGDEGGLFRRRKILEELFDRKFVDAVLNEWMKTMMDLPAGFRQAYEMGLVSSAQMVKFLAINARPTTTRFISRSLPQGISRAFIGRMLADPSFLYKLILEQAATIGCTVLWELENRKERIKQEWDLALINVLTVTACNAFVVWSLAPCRSYGNTFRFDLQNTLQKLPNNIFERSYPFREFDLQKRIHSLFYKAAELCMVGLSAGAVQGSLSNYLAGKKDRLSVTIPSVSTSALERSRLAWLGVEADPLLQSDDLLKKAYNRPSQDVNGSTQKSPRWLISKNAIVSGLGLLGIKQGNVDSVEEEARAPKVRRKRIVRKKVTA
ncbi:hypothetical protein CISIN_1g0096211mg [Citrus sinensis]|uniref:Protein RETICULATA-RELATED 1, chloroplastic n=1 Tax=Citrus sinensis TaxID=2711 RepID=A0A067DG93_CITSI|nr:hypothetical protein CISIN_1g0096211mg [Citrus sinensis]